MAKKRVTRKQLLKEPDEFITFSNRMIRLGVAYKQHVMIAVGIFCAVVLIYVGMQYVAASSRVKAFNLLENAVARYNRQLAQSGPATALAEVEADFELILDKYGSNAGGRMARLTFAQYHFAAGRAERAIELYLVALADFEDDLLYRSLALSGLGYAYSLNGDEPQAIAYFEQVSSGTVAGLKADALFNLGLLYARSGQKDKSKASFERITEEHPESFYAEMAGEKARL